MALFGGATKKFLTEITSSEPDWNRLRQLSKSAIKPDTRDKESGRSLLQLLIRAACAENDVRISEALEDIVSNLARGGWTSTLQSVISARQLCT